MTPVGLAQPCDAYKPENTFNGNLWCWTQFKWNNQTFGCVSLVPTKWFYHKTNRENKNETSITSHIKTSFRLNFNDTKTMLTNMISQPLSIVLSWKFWNLYSNMSKFKTPYIYPLLGHCQTKSKTNFILPKLLTKFTTVVWPQWVSTCNKTSTNMAKTNAVITYDSTWLKHIKHMTTLRLSDFYARSTWVYPNGFDKAKSYQNE